MAAVFYWNRPAAKPKKFNHEIPEKRERDFPFAWLAVEKLAATKQATPLAPGKSGGGPPHSTTLARGTKRPANAERPGVRQPSGALGGNANDYNIIGGVAELTLFMF